ncbi:MAG: hypothetical protein EHM77_09425 [Planctomycetaceae bacterium]|nr:MAG: hypothetical protein EHM77_09425 [Planctomycetaceae bacterium]
MGFEAGAANVRRYVGNAPTNATDPIGLDGVQLSPEELATLLTWLDQPVEAPKQPLMGDVAGENAKGEMVLEYTSFGAYPGDRNARAAYYGSHGPDREDPQGRPRRQYVACSRCHAFNNWGWPKDPDSPPFVDEFGWVNPEYIDKEEPVRTVTNQLLTLVGGAFFLSTTASAFPKGAIPVAPVATSEGIGGAAVTVRTTAARASVGGFVQSESRGAFVIVVDQGTAPSIEGLVSRVYVGASVETQGDLAFFAILPAEARVSESFLLSSQFSLAEFNAPCRLAPESVANSRAIRYTQPTASPNFSMGRHTIQSTMEEVLAGKPASSLPTIRVVEYRGQLYTLDNRRLVAFQNSGLNEIPIRRLSMSDPGVAKEFWRKFNPIEGGTKIVITPNADRAAAEALLREMGKTK